MTFDEGLEAVAKVWQGQDLFNLLYQAKIQGETLTRCQAECTRLLEENRQLRAHIKDTEILMDIPSQDSLVRIQAPRPSSD